VKFTQKYTISSHDVDFNGIVRPSAVLRYMQETTNMQFYVTKPSIEDLCREGKAFILSRFAMSIYEPLYAHDEIEVQTWPCESRSVKFIRCNRIIKNGVIVAELYSIWAFLHLDSRKLIRVSEYNCPFPVLSETVDLESSALFRIPNDVEMSLAGEYTVGYSNIDMYRHMNNTHYPDVLCDFLPSMEGKRVIKMAINFLNEAQLGEIFKVYTTKDLGDGRYLLKTVRRDGKIGVEAEIFLDNI